MAHSPQLRPEQLFMVCGLHSRGEKVCQLSIADRKHNRKASPHRLLPGQPQILPAAQLMPYLGFLDLATSASAQFLDREQLYRCQPMLSPRHHHMLPLCYALPLPCTTAKMMTATASPTHGHTRDRRVVAECYRCSGPQAQSQKPQRQVKAQPGQGCCLL